MRISPLVRGRRVTLAVIWGCLLAASAWADDAHMLAESKIHKLQILADGGAAWCAPHLSLRMVLEEGSPDLGNPAAQLDMMNRLKTPIAADCKAATSADLTVVDQGRTIAYKASAAEGWAFAEVKVAAAPAAATAPAPVPTPTVPAPVVQAPVAQAPAPTSQPASLHVLKDYAGLVVQMVRRDAELAADRGTIHWWTGFRYAREYQQLQNQEFKLQPLLDRGRADLQETIAQSDPDRVTLTINTSFQPYDFGKERFPVAINGDEFNYSPSFCCVQAKVANGMTVKILGIDSIVGLPMEKGLAQNFIERRTHYGSVDRNLFLAVTVKLDKDGFKKQAWGNEIITGVAESAVFYGDRDQRDVLYTLGEDQLSKLRIEKDTARAAAAEAERQRQQAAQEAERQRVAEMQRQQMLAQRDQNIRMLADSTPQVRLANFMAPGPINLGEGLASLLSARAAASFRAKPVEVVMLFQADSSGREKVATAWPGELEVTIPETLPALKSSGWYLVRGQISVPEGDGLKTAQLGAEDVYACTQEKCRDATDPTAVVDRKLAVGNSKQGAP